MKQVTEKKARKLVGNFKGHNKCECQVFTLFYSSPFSGCYNGHCADGNCPHKNTISVPDYLIELNKRGGTFFYIKKEELYNEDYPIVYTGTLLYDGSGIEKIYL